MGLTRQQVEKILAAKGVDARKYPFRMLAIRGWDGKNDRGTYDDLLCCISPDTFETLPFNVDASSFRKGSGVGSGKGMASLKPGTWLYQKGLHRGYEAFRQYEKVTVIRDGLKGNYEDTGWFGINIHRGGTNTTSSLGCQTTPNNLWDGFKKRNYAILSKLEQKVFPYTLVTVEEMSRILATSGAPVGLVPAFSDRFEKCFQLVIDHEGTKYTDHPADKGGPTKYGITLDTLRVTLPSATAHDVEHLTLGQAKIIYKQRYYEQVRGDELPSDKIALVMFDMGVLRGTGRIIRDMQKIVNTAVDGKFGPMTMAALERTPEVVVVRELLQTVQLHFVNIALDNPSQMVFLRGWMNRSHSLWDQVS
jgi:hypothetical protein